MRYLKQTGILLFTLLFLFVAGCAGSTEAEDEEEKAPELGPYYVESMEDLESGCFYIFHEGKYYTPYWSYTSFDVSRTGTSRDKTAWFNEETMENIPTLYKGDYLVYHMDSSFSERFVFDRYQDLGYTIGLCNLRRTSSGRYEFDAISGDKDIFPLSDASRLTELNTESVIIDSIGRAELRSGNISSAGTITGLKEDESYKAEVYVGTKLHAYTIKADSIALSSMDSVTTNDYIFLKSRIIRVNIPEGFNSGYYSVNGSGIFRYVNGNIYDETTNFNVPNERVRAAKQDTHERVFREEKGDADLYPFTVTRETEVVISVNFQEAAENRISYAAPVVKIINSASVYTIKDKADGSFSETIRLPAGRYYLSVSEKNGRAYDYSVLARKEE